MIKSVSWDEAADAEFRVLVAAWNMTQSAAMRRAVHEAVERLLPPESIALSDAARALLPRVVAYIARCGPMGTTPAMVTFDVTEDASVTQRAGRLLQQEGRIRIEEAPAGADPEAAHWYIR